MSTNEPEDLDFEQLLGRYFDGELSPAKSTALIARVKADPACARRFARASLLHDQLRTVFVSDLARQSMEADAPTRDLPLEPKTPLARRWKVVAAVATMAAGILIVVNLWPRTPSAPTTPAAPIASAPPVAVLRTEIAAQWSDQNVDLLLRRGDLPGGPLRLESGTAEFTFEGGATALIEGPAVFEPLARDRLLVTAGRVIGRCPTKQAKLTIVTPGAEVIDLGTEFGVAVGDDRRTQVAVIQGQVELVSAQQPRRLNAGEAVAIDGQGRTQGAAPVIQDFAKLARLIPDAIEAQHVGENRLRDPGMTLAPVATPAVAESSPWRGTAGHVDLIHGRAHAGDTAIRIRALGNPMWPLVLQDVKTGPIDGQIVVGSAWAMQPSDDPLVSRQNAIVKIVFLDAAGREFATAERHFLRFDSAREGWVRGQIAAVAPPGTVAVRFQILLNARGEKSGSLLVDDACLSIGMPRDLKTGVLLFSDAALAVLESP